MKSYLIVAILTLFSFLQSFAKEDLIFEHFLRSEGLSNNSVRKIHQDSRGFLWFGTLNGLNKYDGVRVSTYQYQRGIPGTIGSNRITDFFEDGLGSLWILTNNGKVYRYNEADDTFDNLFDYLDPEDTQNLTIRELYACNELEMHCLTSNKGSIQVLFNPDKSIREVNHYHEKTGLPNNRVNFVYHDGLGDTWIGTNGGLVRIRDKKVINSSNPFKVRNGNQANSFTSYCDLDSLILFGTNGAGVFCYNRGDSTFQHKEEFESTKGANINYIGLSDAMQLMVTTVGKGLFRYQLKNYKSEHFKAGENGLRDSNIYDPFVDSEGLLWFKTTQRGIYQFNSQKSKFKFFPLNAEKRQSIGDSEKIIELEDSYGDLWLGVYGGGICWFDREKNEFEQYMFDPNDPYSITSDYVLTVCEDNSHNLWIGTLRGGVNKISLRNSYIDVQQPVPGADLKIENEVRSVLVDSKNHMWLGTKSGKVFCYDEKSKLLGVIPEILRNKANFQEAGVYCLMEDMKGNLWIGTKGTGIYVIKDLINTMGIKSPLYNEVVSFKTNPETENSISHDDIYALLEVSENEIWVATHNAGLDVIKTPFHKPQFTNYSAIDSISTSISSNQLRCFLKDKDNNVWIGTENGLNLIEENFLHSQDKEFKVLMSDDQEIESLANNDILCITQIKNGDIWCGTFGGGLNYLENFEGVKENLAWKNYTSMNGLSSNMIYAILEDGKGDLWASTDYGISKFETTNKKFINYYTHERIETNVYSENSGDKFQDGRFVFGQVNGFTSFHPDSIGRHMGKYPIYITDFFVSDEKVKPGKKSILTDVISMTKEIKLKHNQNFITFEYAILDYSNPRDIEYAYILENFEDSWNAVGNTSSANYKGLPPGSYTFKVKGTNSEGHWSDTYASVEVVILAPWWKTIYAITAYVILLIIIIVVLGAIILHQLHLQNQVKLEKENTDNKLRFYTNISHELKTPLSLIQGPAEDLVNTRNISPLARHKAGDILKNTKRLLDLIDQLMDFRKIQKGHVALKVSKQDITGFFRNIYVSFLPLAEKRHINFVFEPDEPVEGYIDIDKIEKIVFNLISNAFKHTSKNKTIKVTFNTEETFSFSVIDEGAGIDGNDLPHIFERFKLFTKSEHAMASSSGIGLSLTQELVHIHKGDISVKSVLGEGSAFTVNIPVKASDYTQDEIEEHTITNLHFLDYTNKYVGEEIAYPENDPDFEKRTAGPDASKILIVEDNEELRNYLYYNLKPYYNILLAENGKLGLSIAREEFPDLIICDVMMPEMDGLELTKHLKQDFNTSHIPVILLTAKSSDLHKQEGLESGADVYMTKPFSLHLLKVQVRNLIEQRRKLIQKFGKKVEVSPVDLGGTNADQAFLTKVIAIIEEHMSDPDFNVGTIVGEFGYGRTVFYKKIKGIAGYAPNDFVRIIRMKKAASALKNTEMTVAEISFMTGFNDSNYFSRTFKKHFGVTPSEYRKS